MTATSEQGYRGEDTGSYGRAGRRADDYSNRAQADRHERGFFISTEARPAFVTSEFWLTLIGVTGLVILAYASDALGVGHVSDDFADAPLAGRISVE